MDNKNSFWKKIGVQDWFLKKENTEAFQTMRSVSSDDVYRYILNKFSESISHLSFANRIVFYHEYIIVFNADDYRDFTENKKGIFGLIVQESLKSFYTTLQNYRNQGKTVEPSSSRWVFRFVSHPDYNPGDKGFIGKLLPGNNQSDQNLRVTFIPRQTGIAETSDISPEILKGFTFYSEGYYEAPYQEDLSYSGPGENNNTSAIFARFEAILPDKAFTGKKLEYYMRSDDITVAGKDDTRKSPNIFKIPSEWIDSPHLRIRYIKKDDKFLLASFGEKTLLNEKEVPVSDPDQPTWTELAINSKLVLNGIVGINIFRS